MSRGVVRIALWLLQPGFVYLFFLSKSIFKNYIYSKLFIEHLDSRILNDSKRTYEGAQTYAARLDLFVNLCKFCFYLEYVLLNLSVKASGCYLIKTHL